VRVTLKSPTDVTATTIINTASDTYDNYDVMVDDASSNALNDGYHDSIASPYYDRTAGPSVNGSLDAFDGKNSLGTWTVFVCDDTRYTNGTLNRVKLVVSGDPANEPPDAEAQYLSTYENTPLPITLSGYDQDGDTLTYHIGNDPLYGTLSGTVPDLVYTPQSGFVGADYFDFYVNDGTVDSSLAMIYVDVLDTNTPPVADPQTVYVDEDSSVSITLTGSDGDGDYLLFGVMSGVSYGSLRGIAPNLIYTPATNFSGTDQFTFIVDDGRVFSAEVSVDIIVNPINDPPVANSQMISTQMDTPIGISLTGLDLDGDSLTYETVSTPLNGNLSGTGQNLVYTPISGFTGTDSFTFRVNDGSVDSAMAVVQITVAPSTGPITVFWDDFETDQGWQVNPMNTDTASLGYWERADPEGTYYQGPKQLGDTVSGSYDLVTGPLAGSNEGSYDIDNGTTSVWSPVISIPPGKTVTLSLYYYLAHSNKSSSADFLRITVVGSTSNVVFEEKGARNDDDAFWANMTVDISSYAGQNINILIEAADAAGGSTVEAAIDDVLVIAE